MAPRPIGRTLGRLPFAAMLVVALVNFNEAVQGLIIFPFLPFAVQDWGAPESDVGTWVGTIIGAFFVGQLLFVALWGRASDRYGRRPTLLLGTLGTAFSMTVFGFSTSLPLALLARFLTGALNANVAIAKSFLAEISDSSTSARAFSYLSFSWGAGCIFAPLLGSILAKPAETYPAYFGGISLFILYPYLLPSAVSVVMALVTFTLGYFYLPETEAWTLSSTRGTVNPTAPVAVERSAIDADGSVARDPARDERRRADDEIPIVADADCSSSSETEDDDDRERHQLLSPASSTTASVSNVSPEPIAATSVRHSAAPGTASKTRRSRRLANYASLGSNRGIARQPSISLENAPRGRPFAAAGVSPPVTATVASILPSSLQEEPAPPPPESSSARSLLGDHAIRTAILAYGALATTQVLFDELLPVFCETSIELGGLGLLLPDIGRVQIAQGVAMIIAQLLFVPALINRVGPIAAFRWAMLPIALGVGFFPAVARLARSPTAMWAALAMIMAAKAVLFSLAFSSVMIAINNSARGFALGAVNGFGQSIASLVRALGPLLGGPLYSASIDFTALGSYRLHVIYAVQAAFAAAAFASSFSMPAWLDRSTNFRGSSSGSASADSHNPIPTSVDGNATSKNRESSAVLPSRRTSAVAATTVKEKDTPETAIPQNRGPSSVRGLKARSPTVDASISSFKGVTVSLDDTTTPSVTHNANSTSHTSGIRQRLPSTTGVGELQVAPGEAFKVEVSADVGHRASTVSTSR